MKRNFLKFTIAIACGIAMGCEKPASPDDADQALQPLFAAPEFALTDQDNRPFGTEQLKGKTWIATLFFSTCPGPCPMMQGRLHAIQDAVKDPNVLMVSISIDPKNDTPEKLKAYATRMDADAKRWFFLSGNDSQIKQVAYGLKLGFEPATADHPIIHATKFLLVDKANQVRGIYSTEDDASMKQLAIDAQTVSKES